VRGEGGNILTYSALGRVHADAQPPMIRSSRILDKAGKAPLSAIANCSCQGSQQFVVGRDVVHECDVKPADAQALQAVLDRTTHAVRRVVEHTLLGDGENGKFDLASLCGDALSSLPTFEDKT